MISPLPIKRCARRRFHGLSSAGDTLRSPLQFLLIKRYGSEANPEESCGQIVALPAVGLALSLGWLPLILSGGARYKPFQFRWEKM
jgi:hypothetical protein